MVHKLYAKFLSLEKLTMDQLPIDQQSEINIIKGETLNEWYLMGS